MTTTAAPWFRLFAAEFQSQTSGMKAIEKGVFISLLIAMHEAGEPVTEDIRRLARRSGTTAAAFEGALAALIEAGLIVRTQAGLWSYVAQREIENRAAKSKSAQENASKRWEKDQQNQSSENAAAGKSQSQISDKEREAPKELHASDRSELSGQRSTVKVEAPPLDAAATTPGPRSIHVRGHGVCSVEEQYADGSLLVKSPNFDWMIVRRGTGGSIISVEPFDQKFDRDLDDTIFPDDREDEDDGAAA